MTIQNEELFSHLVFTVGNAVRLIQKEVQEKKITYLTRHYEWPYQQKDHKNGMPSFSKNYWSDNGPINYKSFFEKWKGKSEIELEVLDGFNEYEKYAYENDSIRKRYYMVSNDGNDRVFKIGIKLILENLVDKYLHTFHPEEEFDVERFKEIYTPIENYLENEELEIDLVFPLLFLKFDFDAIKIAENVLLERMDKKFQLARTKITNYGVPVNETAINATTHALIFKNFYMENTNYFQLVNNCGNENFYPLEKPDMLINCIRIVLGLETGYAQLITRPVDWADDYEAYLPNIHGTLKRGYPAKFDKFYWLKEEMPIVSAEQMQSVGTIFEKVERISSPKIEVAMKRLKYCYLRESEEDAVLDVMIALETLLSDGEKSELNHKLALRISALFSLDYNIKESSHEIFMTVKKIYDYRSAIVHGSSRKTVDKKRELKIEGSPTVPLITKAIEYLRIVILIVINNPQFLEARKIDEEILLKNLK